MSSSKAKTNYKPNVDLSNVLNKTVLDVYGSKRLTADGIELPSKFRTEARYDVYKGGAGSGKSRFIAQKILYRIIYQPNHRYLIIRKVKDTMKASVFQLFLDYIYSWGVESKFHITKSPMQITHKKTGNTIMFMGVDNPEKLKSIEKITSIWIEEASELDEADFNELDRRLRGKLPNYKQIHISFNPISHLHWLKKRFFDNPPENIDIIETTYLDNPKLEDEDKQVLLEMKKYDEQQYNIYALGNWGVLNQNIVYHNYDYNKHTTHLTVNDFDELHIGIDFNVGGCVGVVCGIKDGKVYVVDSWSVYDTDAIVTRLMIYKGKRITLYPDSSGDNRTANASKTNITILKDGGYYCDVPKKNPAVRDRVNSVNRMFAMDKLYVNVKLEKITYALQTHAYTEKGEPEKFTDHQGGSVDDYNDALGYFINQRFGILKGTFGNVKLTYR